MAARELTGRLKIEQAVKFSVIPGRSKTVPPSANASDRWRSTRHVAIGKARLQMEAFRKSLRSETI